MKRIVSKPPSREKRKFFVWCYPQWKAEEKNWKAANAWISIEGMAYKKSGLIYPPDIFSNIAISPVTDVDKFLRRVDYAMIEVTIRNHNKTMALAGKWMIHVQRKDADRVWEILTDQIDKGRLPCFAKISTCRKNKFLKNNPRLNHVICVYTPNFLWRENVREVRLILRESGFRRRIYYKPDIFTVLEAGRVGSYFNLDIFKHLQRSGVGRLRINHRYFG